MRKKLTSLLAVGAAVMGLSVVMSPQSASAAVGPGEDRQLTAPAGWWTYTGVTVAQINTTLSANSARLTDVSLDQATGTYTVTEVANSGAYASGWWWYVNVTPEQGPAARHRQQRPADRLNCVLRGECQQVHGDHDRNTGANAEGWSVYYGTQAFINSKVNPATNRLVSLSRIQGSSNYAALFGSNTGTRRRELPLLLRPDRRADLVAPADEQRPHRRPGREQRHGHVQRDHVREHHPVVLVREQLTVRPGHPRTAAG